MRKFKHFFNRSLIVVLCLALLGLKANAQYVDEGTLPQQGDLVLSGALLARVASGLGVFYTDVKGSRTTSVSVSGDYLFTNDFAFGLSLGFSEVKADGESARATAFEARATYFLRPRGGTALPYLSVGYLGLDVGGEKPSGFSVRGGVQLFLTRSVALDLGLQYVNLRASGTTRDGFTVGLGLSYWLRRD
jgi:opacity protein-like surface antigen